MFQKIFCNLKCLAYFSNIIMLYNNITCVYNKVSMSQRIRIIYLFTYIYRQLNTYPMDPIVYHLTQPDCTDEDDVNQGHIHGRENNEKSPQNFKIGFLITLLRKIYFIFNWITWKIEPHY